MADFADTSAGRALAEALCITRMTSHAWTVGHMGINDAGHTIVRFQRPMAVTSATTREYGAWTESRADDTA